MPLDKSVADNKNSFALTDEEIAYVRSLDGQVYGAKEALESVLEAAQSNYEKTMTRLNLAKENFIIHLANKHKVTLTSKSTIRPLDGLFILNSSAPTPDPDVTSELESPLEDIKNEIKNAGLSTSSLIATSMISIIKKLGLTDSENLLLLFKYCAGAVHEFPSNLKNAQETSIFRTVNAISQQLIIESGNTALMGVMKAISNKDAAATYAAIKDFCFVPTTDENKKSACDILQDVLKVLAGFYFKVV